MMTSTTTEQVTLGRRTISKGDVLKFTHVRGDYTFMKAYVEDDGTISALMVVGGVGLYRKTRMLAPDKIAKKYRASTLEAKGRR
jgi:hypothetical protein